MTPWSGSLDKRTIADLKEYVIEPLGKKIDSFETELRLQLHGFREEFNKSLDQTAAAIRAMTDPTTGYVPRSEVMLIREKADDERERMRTEFDRRFDDLRRDSNVKFDELRKNLDDRFEKYSRETDRKVDSAVNQFRMVGGAIAAVLGLLFTFMHFLKVGP